MNYINTVDDLFDMLDRYTEGVDWDTFYTNRDKPAPFLKYNKLPDKCIVDFMKKHAIKNACEFGCGEGFVRNCNRKCKKKRKRKQGRKSSL